MSGWFSKDLGEAVGAIQAEQDIRNAFLPIYVAAGQPGDMAVFLHRDPELNVFTVFFSPGASALAKRFGAGPCEKPKRDRNLSRSAGDARAWDIFYPRTR